MWAAYQGTADYAGESVEDAEAEIAKTFAGAYGLYWPQHSCVVERDAALICSALVTSRNASPFLAFAMTAPEWQRHGLAKATIGHVMQDLFEAGATRLELVVNARNKAAVDLYRRLGFKPARSDA